MSRTDGDSEMLRERHYHSVSGHEVHDVFFELLDEPGGLMAEKYRTR